MKARSLCASTLVAILGVTVLGAATPAFAAPTELTSEGKVKIEEGTAGGKESPGVDPENPGTKLPDPDPVPGGTSNPDTGSLLVEKTSNLDFGTIKTSANAVSGFAKAVSFNSGKFTRGNYVQWVDVRSGGTYGYNITAQLTKQFTSGTNVLTGSTIDFSNGTVTAQGDNTNTVPGNVSTSFQLSESSEAVTVVTASQSLKEGKGRYIMAFGKSTDSTDANSVKLTVPASTASNMAAGDYTATLTWKIVAAPVENPGA